MMACRSIPFSAVAQLAWGVVKAFPRGLSSDVVEHRIRHKPLQPRVVLFQGLQPPGVVRCGLGPMGEPSLETIAANAPTASPGRYLQRIERIADKMCQQDRLICIPSDMEGFAC